MLQTYKLGSNWATYVRACVQARLFVISYAPNNDVIILAQKYWRIYISKPNCCPSYSS